MASPRRTGARPLRSERLEARVSPTLKARLQRAASVRGQSLTEFIVSAATEAADRAVYEHDVVTLTARDQVALVEALLAPAPAPAPKLVRAVKLHRKSGG